MPNNANVIAKFNAQDKDALREVALRLCGGNQSEVLRVLVRTTLQVLKEQDAHAAQSSGRQSELVEPEKQKA